MPVYKTIAVKDNRLLAIWHIEESFEQMLNQLNPNETDQELLLSFKNEKKQLEWLSGRLTLKYLATQIGIDYNGVVKDEDGKPSLQGHKHEISLTHSFPYVAAIIDTTQPVGIDLEQPREKVKRIAHKFLSQKELEFANNDTLNLNMMWCIKETLYKIYGKKGLIFKDQLYIEPFALSEQETITGNIIANTIPESHKLGYIVNSDYILTYNL